MNLRSLLTNHSCNVCGKILLGVAYQDWSGNRVCEEHNKCFCSSCGRYYGAKATEIVSGEWLCENCKNNLPDKAGVEKTVSYIRTFYKQHGLEVQSHVVLKGVTAAQMARLYSSDARGYVELPQSSDGYHIIVRRYLARAVLAMVLSHELLHVWQYEHHIYPPAAICEGFCNLGAYLIMQSIHTPTAMGQIELLNGDTDAIYGEGFRTMRTMYEQKGLPAVITYMKSFR